MGDTDDLWLYIGIEVVFKVNKMQNENNKTITWTHEEAHYEHL